MKKRRSDVILNLKLIFYLVAILVIFIISIYPRNLSAEVLFSDKFDRANSLDVGGNWTELSELMTAQYINGYLVDAGYYDVRDNRLAFHIYGSELRFQNYYSSSFARPYMTAPLAHPISSYPVKISYKFTVNSDEALCFGLSLMSSASGMKCANNCAVDSYKAPMNGIIFRASRSSSTYSNSVFGVLIYENGNYYWPVSTSLGFQFTAGVEYSVNITLYENSATINLTDTLGHQASMTTSQFSLNFPLDTVLIYNDAGLSYGNFDVGDFIMYFDDVIITGPDTPTNQAPAIDSFLVLPASGAAPLSVNLTCSAHDSDGAVATYTIDYGDGTTPETNSTGSFMHTYNTAGSYQVTCAVVDNLGAMTISNGTTINVSVPPPSNQPPVIDSFSVYPNSGNPLVPFNFTCAAHDPDGTVNGYTIDYGDGSSQETNSTGSFTHTYDTAGSYQATCTAIDNLMANNLSTVTINVSTRGKTYGLFVGKKDGDLRGDINASRVALKFKEMDGVAEVFLITNEYFSLTVDLLANALNSLNSKLEPGDNLYIYIAGHGGSDTSQIETTLNPGNEFIRLDIDLTDNDLYNLLNNNIKKGVNKVVLLDACHSGGFWGNDNQSDVGDLEKLQRIALFAAAAEDNIGFWNSIPYTPNFGRTFYSLALEKAFSLHDGFLCADLDKDGVVSFDELTEYVRDLPAYWGLDGTVVAEMAFGDLYTFSREMWKPISVKSMDFPDFLYTKIATESTSTDVDIDILPNAYPNIINLSSKGNTPVAVLGSYDLDVSKIDPESIELANVHPYKWNVKDVNLDGRLDLILHFETRKLTFTVEDTVGRLKGRTFDGTLIQGLDEITIMDCTPQVGQNMLE